MLFRSLLVVLAASFFFAGCRKVTDADQQAAVACVRANVAAMEKGDPEAVLATLHPKSAAYTQTPTLLQFLKARFKLAYSIESAEVQKTSSDGIWVHFVQVTRKVGGTEAFPDNRVEGVHLLKRDGDAWKIWSTQVLQSRTLDGKPLPTL